MANTNTSTTRTNSLGKMRPGREEGLGKRPKATRDMNARPGLGEICSELSVSKSWPDANSATN